jgi:competence ComEA-like helix-hairpin-helix protein
MTVLILVMLFLILSPFFYNRFFQTEYASYASDSVKLDSLFNLLLHPANDKRVVERPLLVNRDTVFLFDPNQISFQQMILLGFDSIHAWRILKYRKHGGRFYEKKDLLKIYGLPEKLYYKLEDYISISENEKIDASNHYKSVVTKENHEKENTTGEIFLNINAADTNDLKQIKGIGSVLSARIVKYRDLLGGYSNIDQLNNVYGLKDRALEHIKTVAYVDSSFVPDRIKINYCEWEDLVPHPYINSQLANDIIHLRSNRGYLNGMNDLREIQYLNDSILHQLKPYFEF